MGYFTVFHASDGAASPAVLSYSLIQSNASYNEVYRPMARLRHTGSILGPDWYIRHLTTLGTPQPPHLHVPGTSTAPAAAYEISPGLRIEPFCGID